MKEAVVFGAGNIGRGFMGQLFSESGYRVTFVDIDTELVNALAEQQGYRLQTVFNDDVRDYRIEPVTAVSGTDSAGVADVVARADIGATAVGAGALKYIVPNIATGLKARIARNAPPLNLIICENLKNAAAIVRDMIAEQLDAETRDHLSEVLGLVDTVIGRMVPLPTPEMRAEDVSLIRVEPYKELPVDRNGFAGDVPEIEAMRAYADFAVFTARKLYIHNCGHALLAYVGYLRDHEYGYEALADPEVRRILNGGLQESKAGIVAKYDVKATWLAEHIDDLMERFGNRALGDTIFRLGRDPVRKLAATDRLIAPARLAEEAGVDPANLAFGIAAALLFDPAQDPVAQNLQQKLRDTGAAATLEQTTGIRSNEPLGKLVLSHFARLCPAKHPESR